MSNRLLDTATEPSNLCRLPAPGMEFAFRVEAAVSGPLEVAGGARFDAGQWRCVDFARCSKTNVTRKNTTNVP
ncbi:MAG: hypothetical protein RLZZ393_203 [Pseudomonadota bacterium]